MSVSVNTTIPTAPPALIESIGTHLVDALNALAALSVAVTAAAKAAPVTPLPARNAAPVARIARRPLPPVPAAKPVTPWLEPLPAKPARKPRVTARAKAKALEAAPAVRGIEAMKAALYRREGVSPSELTALAGYATGPAVLDRFAGTHGFRWYSTGEGASKRYFAKPDKGALAAQKAIAAALRRH